MVAHPAWQQRSDVIMSRFGRVFRHSWYAILLAALLASVLVGCGGEESAFTPPPPTVIRATESEVATPAPQAEQPTATPAPEVPPQQVPTQNDTPYPLPQFVPVTPVVYPAPQS
jgi:hypothetical protein